MARSLAGESAVARGGRSLGAWMPRPSLRTRPRRRSRPTSAPRGGGPLALAPLRALRAHRRLVLALTAAALVAGGGWLWLRHSSLVAVEHVRVSGIAGHGSEAEAIEAALVRAARGMSTLDVHPAQLRAAVASFPIVRSVTARSSFPHGLRIQVAEQPPVAALEANGTRTAVAADGVALGPRLLSGSLPVVRGSTAGAQVLPLTGHRVEDPSLLSQLTVLGAAPGKLGALVSRAYMGPHGVTVVLANRLVAFFGDATRPHAKWLSLARVLIDPSAMGAAYIDVRVPERPAAGFAPGTARAGAGGENEPSSASDPTTAAELAAGLEAAVSGGANPGVSAASTAGSPEASGTPAGGGEGSSGEGSGPGGGAQGATAGGEAASQGSSPQG